jgi:MYXO-CTERM domain-containing protein
MTHPRLLSVAFAAVVLCLASRPANAQILLNGGFELPLISSGSTSTATPTSWTDSSDFIISNGNGVTGNTPYGSQYLDLTPSATLSQQISGFTANQTYVLGFDYEYQTGDPLALTVSVSGAANSTASFALNVSGAGFEGANQIPFQSGVLVFTASSSGSATISFSNLGAAVALDNVGLYGNIVTPPATPEPSTYAEMLLGLVALAGLGLMRRQSARA